MIDNVLNNGVEKFNHEEEKKEQREMSDKEFETLQLESAE